MKKAVKRILIGLAALIALLLAALPFALPPLVKGIAEAKAAELGFPCRIDLDLGYAWDGGPELAGSLDLRLLNSPVEAHAAFGLGLGTWHARLKVPPTELTENTPVVEDLRISHPLPKGISNLTFRATVSLEASAERTHGLPVPVWSAKAPVRVDSASLVRDGKPISCNGLAVTAGAAGIADRLDISPMFLRIASADAGGFALTNVTAAIHATKKALLVTEAKAGVCDGTASVYSLFLDPKTLNAGFTLFLDNIDAGEILSHFRGFRGEASGRLHGKIRLFLKEGGRSVRLSDAFLYSTPGETGKLKMANAEIVTDNLALAGVDAGSRQNVANALADLDYSVLKLDLKPVSGDDATLGVQLSGTATRDSQTVPVDLTVNFHGKLEQLLNTGLGLSDRLKGKKR